MTRSAALVVALLLAACGFIHLPQNTAGTRMEVTSHCGLAFITIEYEEKEWRFADVDPNDANAPPGWGFNDSTIYLEEVDGELIAHGPDGHDYRLVERTGERPWGCL